MPSHTLEERLKRNRNSLTPGQTLNRIGLAATGAKTTGQNVAATLPAGFQVAGTTAANELAFQKKSAAEHRIPGQIERLTDVGVDPTQALATLRGDASAGLLNESRERIAAIGAEADVAAATARGESNVATATLNAQGREAATGFKEIDSLNDSIFTYQTIINNPDTPEAAKAGYVALRNRVQEQLNEKMAVVPGATDDGGSEVPPRAMLTANAAAKAAGQTTFVFNGQTLRVK